MRDADPLKPSPKPYRSNGSTAYRSDNTSPSQTLNSSTHAPTERVRNNANSNAAGSSATADHSSATSSSNTTDSSNRPVRKPSVALRSLYYYGRITRRHLGLFLLALFSTLGFVVTLTFGNPYVVGLIVDRVSLGEHLEPERVLVVFAPYILALIGINVLGQVCSKLQDYAVWKITIKANYDLATHVFDTLANQSMTFHSNRFGGSLVSQTLRFISGYTILMECLIYALLPILLTAVLTVAILGGLIPLYVVLLCVLLAIYVLAAWLLYKRVLPLNSAAAAAQNSLSGELSDSITNILAVKTYGREAHERQLFNAANRDVFNADSRRMRSSTARGAITSTIIVCIMTLLVIFITGGSVWFGISAGTLVIAFTYTYALTMQFNRLNMTFQQVNRGFGDAHDMTLILDEPTLVADAPGAATLVVSAGSIDFEAVDFAYTDNEEREHEEAKEKPNSLFISQRVFCNLNLRIPGGQRLGLVGRSGSGKTTLTTLLLRLNNLEAGRILIDGQDIAGVTQVSLRQQIAYVPQEPLLFHRTIYENIAYGRPDASLSEVRDAAAKANALDFISRLPAGFDTITGERGIKLSGGQRQRIAIARAILADKPILLLDEATSALDSESEKLIQEAMANLLRGRTSIVVAHRLSTVASLDRIIVLRDGHIVEDGTHQELVARGGEYAHLWNRQTGDFLADH